MNRLKPCSAFKRNIKKTSRHHRESGEGEYQPGDEWGSAGEERGADYDG